MSENGPWRCVFVAYIAFTATAESNNAFAQTVESTGFEAATTDGGWEAGFSVCGSAGLSPNPNNGWSAAVCTEPHIDTVNPKTGMQHLRFQYDPALPVQRCEFLDCPNQVATPPQGPPPIAPTRISFDIAGRFCTDFAGICDASLFLLASSADESEPYTVQMTFHRFSLASVSSGVSGEETGLGFFAGGLQYDRIEIELDPCTNTQTYRLIEPNGIAYEVVQSFEGKSLAVSQVLFAYENWSETIWDIDNFLIERGTPCQVGVCCDRTPGAGGLCEEIVTPDNCVGEFLEWSETRYCSDIVCTELTDACCDRTPGAGRCLDGVLASECAGQNEVWTVNATCAKVACEEFPGACCDKSDPTTATCTANHLRASKQVWPSFVAAWGWPCRSASDCGSGRHNTRVPCPKPTKSNAGMLTPRKHGGATLGHGTRRQSHTYGSVGTLGGQLPRITQPAKWTSGGLLREGQAGV